MNRSRDYYRKMRAKHIKRKKSIVHNWKWWGDNPEYYQHDGMYSKNKIHCSCPLCSEKARNNGKHVKTLQELRQDYAFKQQLVDLI